MAKKVTLPEDYVWQGVTYPAGEREIPDEMYASLEKKGVVGGKSKAAAKLTSAEGDSSKE